MWNKYEKESNTEENYLKDYRRSKHMAACIIDSLKDSMLSC